MVSFLEYTTLTFCLTLGVHSKLSPEPERVRLGRHTHPVGIVRSTGRGSACGIQPLCHVAALVEGVKG